MIKIVTDNFLYEKEKVLALRYMYDSAKKPGITIITVTNKQKYIKNIMDNFRRCLYPKKEFIIILNDTKLQTSLYKNYFSKTKNLKLLKVDSSYSLGECLNLAISKSNYNYIAKMDDDDYYGSHYILDSMNAFNYTDASIIGKTTHFIYFEDRKLLNLWCQGNENTYATSVAGATFVMKKSIFNKVKFNNLSNGEDIDLLSQCNNLGIKIYSCSKFNYVYNRHASTDNHSWKISNDLLVKRSIKLCITKNYKRIVHI
ncbi:glycosyl transferase [Clostridium acetobutylicum]|nr:glycosyl transferase [Clostridium acetobutylicum]